MHMVSALLTALLTARLFHSQAREGTPPTQATPRWGGMASAAHDARPTAAMDALADAPGAKVAPPLARVTTRHNGVVVSLRLGRWWWRWWWWWRWLAVGSRQ